jgi:hypothetical protein
MMNFREFIETKSKAWKAKKAEVLQFWQNLKPNMPIRMEPVPETHEGTRFRSDGMRITGSPEFINSVMSRIKDIMQMENEYQRLDVEYRQIENPDGDDTPGTQEFVFYCHLVQKNAPAPKQVKPKIPKPPKAG